MQVGHVLQLFHTYILILFLFTILRMLFSLMGSYWGEISLSLDALKPSDSPETSVQED